MTYSGFFEINVTGDPRKISSIASFEAMIHNKALRIDPDVQLTENNFARMTYNMVWTGEFGNLNAITFVWSTLGRIIDTHLDKWTYTILAMLTEKGGP